MGNQRRSALRAASRGPPKRSLGMTRTDQLGPTPVVATASKRRTATSQRVMALTVVDQGASSVSNFALALIVAHYSSASALGVFAILTATYVLSQGLVRSLSSDCLLTRSENDEGQRSKYERGGYLAAIVLSIPVGVLAAAVSGLLPHAFTLPFVIFAVSFPLMACQDFARFIGISRYDPAYAIWLDLTWLVLFLIAYVVLKEQGLTTLAWLFGAWSGAGALVGLWTLRPTSPRTSESSSCASGTRAGEVWACASRTSSCSSRPGPTSSRICCSSCS